MASLVTTSSSVPFSRARREEAWDFRLIFATSFAIFLVAAVVGRLLPWRWSPRPAGRAGSRSVIAEARATTNTFVPFAFMG